MTGIEELPARRPDGARLVLDDLALICGTLSEISTAWRRAKPYLPGLPLSLPAQLQDAARQLASDIQRLAEADPPRPLPLSATGRFCALKQGIASAQAMTRGPGIPEVGDGKLWETLAAPLHRVEADLDALGPRLVTADG